MVAYSIGSYFAQMPVGDRKSGMPLSVEMPAPVRTTHGWCVRMRFASLATSERKTVSITKLAYSVFVASYDRLVPSK